MLSINSFSGSFLSICDIFLLISDTLSIDSDNVAIIDLMLSINLFSGSFLLVLSCPFLIGAEKVMHFSVFSPKQSKLPLNSFANCLIIK